MDEFVSIAAIAAISALALAFGHYFNWRGLLGRDLTKIESYVYGTAWLHAPMSVYLWLAGYSQAVIVQWAVIAVAGAMLMVCYWVDSWIRHRNGRIDAEEREQQALRQVYDKGSEKS